MIASYNTLGQAIFRTLSAPRMVQWRGRERAEPAGNVVISPLSIGMTLAMGFAAAAGETAEEMARALGFDAPRPDLLKANADLLRHYGEGDAPEGFRLRLANALVLTQHGDAVAKSFRDLLADSFAAEIFEGDVARVNQWVAQKTEGKIERVLADLPQDDIAVLVNAIYFKAPWAEAFKPTSTHDGRFFLSEESRSSMMEGDGIDVKMMHAVRDFVIVQGAGYRAARLPYKPPSLGMIIVLPDPIEGLDYIEALDAVLERFRRRRDHATARRIRARNPLGVPALSAALSRPLRSVLEAGPAAGRHDARLRLDARRFQRHDGTSALGDSGRNQRRSALRLDRGLRRGHRGRRRDFGKLPHRRHFRPRSSSTVPSCFSS